jgi:hypothetical protein
MRKIFLLVLIVGMTASFSFAQVDKSFYRSSYESRNNGTFNTSTSIVSFGIGFPNIPQPYYGGSRFSLGPIYGKYEHGLIRDEVGLGGYASFSQGWYEIANEKYSVTAFSVALLGYYHFNKLIPVKRLDVYAGAGFQVRAINDSYDYGNNGLYYRNSEDGSHVDFVGKLGVRYYFGPSFGLYAETGFDYMSSVNLGVSFRM